MEVGTWDNWTVQNLLTPLSLITIGMESDPLPAMHVCGMCRYMHERDDRSMEVSWQQMQAEERRSVRAGRDADAEAEREEQRRVAAKKARKKLKKAGAKSLLAA